MADETRTIQEHAEDLLGYWEIHGEQPEVVQKWAMEDMFGILRHITEGGE